MIVHLYDNNKARQKALKDFIYANKDTAIVFDKDRRCVGTNELHIFLTGTEYEMWCKGRTYMLDEKSYHSGYEIKADCEVNDAN